MKETRNTTLGGLGLTENIPSLFFDTDVELYISNLSDELNLPPWYDFNQFKNDILAMFLNKPKKLGRRNIATIHQNQDLREKFLIEEWARIQRFYVTFPKTTLFREILKHFRPFDAARWFINLLVAKSENITGDRYDKASTADTMSLLLAEGKNGDIDIPFLKAGSEAGDGHYSIRKLKQSLKILQILKQLMIKYRGASYTHVEKIETPLPADDLEPIRIRSFLEVVHAFTTEFSLQEELFDYRLATKQVLRPQWLQRKTHPKKYIMLLDVSGSMDDNDKYLYAIASAIALIKNAQKSNVNKAVIIPFDDDVHQSIDGDAKQCITELLQTPFSGGGTDIDNALEYADNLEPDEIILITDGEDDVTYKPNAKLYTIFCLPGGNEHLQKISYSYEEVNTDEY